MEILGNLSVARKLLLGVATVIYLAGTFGIAQTALAIGFEAWQVTILIALYSVLLIVVGWVIYNFETQ
ncbi:MAG: hypothetical protein HY247_07315 [archaeon]|nr:MAG: hypothetical protein HY247_07315 [archaeon]